MRLLTTLLAGFVGFTVAFVLGLHVHFPGEAARDRLAWELQERSKGGWMLDAADARLYRLTGLELEDATLLQVQRPRGRGAAEQEPTTIPVLRVDRVAARLRILPLLSGEKAARYHAELYGGRLDGVVEVSDVAQRLVIEGSDIDLSRIPLEGEEWTVDAAGGASVDGDITLDLDNIKQSSGHLALELHDLVLNSATILGMTLEPTPFSEAVLSFDVDGGRARVDKGSFRSEPVEATVEGEIVLNKQLPRSRLKLSLLVHFSEQFDKLASMAPNLKAARDEDGGYHFKITGTIQRPRLREERQTRRSTRTPTRPRTTTPRTPSTRKADGGASDDDAEARRQARRERIRQRREKMLERRNSRNGRDRGPDEPPTEFDPDVPLPGQPPLQEVRRFGDEEIYDPEEGDLPPDDFGDDEGPPEDMDLALPPDAVLDEEY